MKFKEILKRITGISTPIAGISWDPTDTDKDCAKEVIAFLEDRRVLYNPSEMEVPSHCVESIMKIREFLTQKSGLVKDDDLKNVFKAMRSACRKFLDFVGSDGDIITYGNSHGHWASWAFNGAVGELRGVFGIHLAKLAAMYGLDIEEDLATILPVEDK